MQIYRDQDADLSYLENRRIAVIGYGNQGRSQALNLRDSGLQVVIGNQDDGYAKVAEEDGFEVLSISQAVSSSQVVMLLIPDEVMPAIFQQHIQPHLHTGDVLVFASGYNVAFELLLPPPDVDIVLVAPRMIGTGVRDLYLQGRGFPSFIGVSQDFSGQAQQIALALAKGIGSTRYGAVQVTFRQEAELDLFTEQCFGPAFGSVLTSAVDLLLEQGYPPAAVLLELYMSGELAYTFQKMAEMGIIEQSSLHSRTSQYGSLTRGMRFLTPETRQRMLEGLEEIRSGDFAREWQAEQAAGTPTLDTVKAAARSMPLHQLEQELLQATGALTHLDSPPTVESPPLSTQPIAPNQTSYPQKTERKRFGLRAKQQPTAKASDRELDERELHQVLEVFLRDCRTDQRLLEFSQERQICFHYQLSSPEIEFYMQFENGLIETAFVPPPVEAQVLLLMEASVMDGVFTRRINPMRAALSGQMRFQGDARRALSSQSIQDDLCRLYTAARSRIDDGK